MARPLAILLGTLVLVSGCKRESESVAPDAAPSVHPLDTNTEALLLALRQDDQVRLAELGTPELVAELDERARAELKRTLDYVGAVEALVLVEENALVGGTERVYRVRFEQGEVGLTITSSGAVIGGFEFASAEWTTLVDAAANAAAGDLRVAEFVFTTPEGEALESPADAKAIHYVIAIEGLASNLREHEISVSKVVVNPKGAEVYKEREEEQIRFPAAEVGSSGGRITGMVAVPKKGSYELRLTITDRIALVTIEHAVPFTIR